MQPQSQQQMFNQQMYDMQQQPGLQNQLVQQQMQMSQLFRQDQGNLFESQQEANNQQMLKKLQEKLTELKDEVLNMDKNIEIFKNHQLPLARVKKIMKSDEDMISAEAPILFAKACEIFIIELTFRAWMHTEESKRRTLQKIDIGACIQNTDIFDFLIDIIPKDEFKPNQALGAQPNPVSMDQSNQMQTGVKNNQIIDYQQAYLNQFMNSQQSQQNPSGISNLMLVKMFIGQQQFLQQQQQNSLQQQQNDFQMQLQQQPQNLIGQQGHNDQQENQQ